MRKTRTQRRLYIVLFFLSILIGNAQTKPKFKVVLDAGHGGKDPGANYYGVKEKNVALETTLKIGKILENYSDIKVIYTRKTDVFIELVDRPKVANSEDADLFVSIHCNGAKNVQAYGTETFVMGLSRSAANLEVAKKENSVILLENNYQEKYNGFDPTKPESLIGMKLLQEEYLNQSIDLASKIEFNFDKKNNRLSRGVKQAPLWVLDASYMPSVLVELGFLSNKEENVFLASDKGQQELAQAIADAILAYKKEQFGGVTNLNNTQPPRNEITKPIITETINETPKSTNGVIFKVQISASASNLETKPSNFKGLTSISVEKTEKLYKYFYGEEPDYEIIKKRLQEAKEKGYNSAFIVAYKDGVKINVSDALK